MTEVKICPNCKSKKLFYTSVCETCGYNIETEEFEWITVKVDYLKKLAPGAVNRLIKLHNMKFDRNDKYKSNKKDILSQKEIDSIFKNIWKGLK